jgi:hypothetical protein
MNKKEWRSNKGSLSMKTRRRNRLILGRKEGKGNGRSKKRCVGRE